MNAYSRKKKYQKKKKQSAPDLRKNRNLPAAASTLLPAVIESGSDPAAHEKREEKERISMPETSDIKVWKDILSELKANSEQNEVVISEIQEEIALQQQRNKQEVMTLCDTLREQTKSLEELLHTVKTGGLFTLPADHKTQQSFEQSLEERLENSRQLLDYAQNLLEAGTTPSKTLETLHKPVSAPDKESVRAQFPRHALLGNWIHYFTKEMFTCQCFWDDSEFKEYDFKDNRLVEERSGTFKVENNKVIMDYEEGKQAVYTVTGYSDDCLDYLINRTPIRFDYMPEDLLNNLLEGSSTL